MSERPQENLTQLLNLGFGGDRAALERVWAQIVGELRRMAHAHRFKKRCPTHLQTTELVNEGYLRLMNHPANWENRRHFFGAFKKAMRLEQVDDVRKNGRLKRGGGMRQQVADLDALADGGTDRSVDRMDLEEALARLEKADPRKALLVEMIVYGEMGIDQAAAALQVSPRTVDRDWKVAKTLLYRDLNPE